MSSVRFCRFFLLFLSLGLVQWHIILVQTGADAQMLCPLCQYSKYYCNLQLSNKIGQGVWYCNITMYLEGHLWGRRWSWVYSNAQGVIFISNHNVIRCDNKRHRAETNISFLECQPAYVVCCKHSCVISCLLNRMLKVLSEIIYISIRKKKIH